MPSDSTPAGILADLFASPDRAASPGQPPVCSLNGEEDPKELQAWAPWVRERLALSRRGIDHGEWLVLREGALEEGPTPPLDAWLEQHWYEARPIPLRAWAEPLAPGLCEAWHRTLWEPKGLRQFLTERAKTLGETFAPGSNMHLFDADRDRERIRIGADHDLWIKCSRLSRFPEDHSLRVRHSFGKEGPDDLSRDTKRHRLVTELAEILWPMAARFPKADIWSQRMAEWIGGPVLRTQHIAYFNAPEGGALWHHDAFDEPLEGGQRGVLYVQLAGRTAWLACSIDEFCKRVLEFLEYLSEGELPWVLSEALPAKGALEGLMKMAERFPRLRRELGRPGCGAFAPLVGRGEFTALCADAGHAFVLDPGDALLLANHGLERTVMHSVFCADPAVTLGLSMGLREDREEPEPRPSSHRSARRSRSRRGPSRRG